MFFVFSQYTKLKTGNIFLVFCVFYHKFYKTSIKQKPTLTFLRVGCFKFIANLRSARNRLGIRALFAVFSDCRYLDVIL